MYVGWNRSIKETVCLLDPKTARSWQLSIDILRNNYTRTYLTFVKMTATENGTNKAIQSYVNTMPSSNFTWQITLAEKVIAITGANRGIGLGIAEVCFANSAKVVYSLDLMDPGEDFAGLQKKYSNFRYIQTDVTSEESVQKAVDQIVEENGRVDGLVANAGMTKHQPALQFDRPELEKLFNLNVSISWVVWLLCLG